MELNEHEKRRADNMIWTAAQDYSFAPEFRIYDKDGRADLYWNSIIGAARRNYGAKTIDALFSSLRGTPNEELYEQLLWLGLENAVFEAENPRRPALLSLRLEYAEKVLRDAPPVPSEELPVRLEEAHFRRVLGEDPKLLPRDREILDALEIHGDLTGEELSAEIYAFLKHQFHFVPGRHSGEDENGVKPPFYWRLLRKIEAMKPPARSFIRGYADHSAGPLRSENQIQSLSQSEDVMRQFMKDYFGPPLLSKESTKKLEDMLCTDAHDICYLYFARGEGGYDQNIVGFAGARRKDALAQMEQNRIDYRANELRNRFAIERLSQRIQNAILTYMRPTIISSPAGTLDSPRVWRALYAGDDKVFTKVLQSDVGDFSVDLLLDGSGSQQNRRSVIAAQGYIIAEALTRCEVPVRVSSFASLSGFTIVTRFRDYYEKDRNPRIFNYFTTGCNRDGLAIRALGKGIEDSPCEHKLLILLSDAEPHDIMKMRHGDEYVEYEHSAGILNTAAEVRKLTDAGTSVLCVFTGDDENVPAAQTIYGRNFVRIHSMDKFGDVVGTLIQTKISNF